MRATLAPIPKSGSAKPQVSWLEFESEALVTPRVSLTVLLGFVHSRHLVREPPKQPQGQGRRYL
jgi:hypothetical protein